MMPAAGGRLETRTPYRKGVRIEILRIGAARNRCTSFQRAQHDQVLIRMGSNHRTMRPGPGPIFPCSNQRLWRMIPSFGSSQAIKHGLVPLQYPSFYRSLLPPASVGNARRKLGPVASLQHGKLSSARLSTQTEISRSSRCERPKRTPVSDRQGTRNPHISMQDVYQRLLSLSQISVPVGVAAFFTSLGKRNAIRHGVLSTGMTNSMETM